MCRFVSLSFPEGIQIISRILPLAYTNAHCHYLPPQIPKWKIIVWVCRLKDKRDNLGSYRLSLPFLSFERTIGKVTDDPKYPFLR